MDKKKIIIIEDDRPALESLKKLLVMSGFEAEGCLDPKKAVEITKAFQPDIILLDLLMPVVGGLEVAQMLYNEKETRGIPIIIVSALGGYADIKKAYQSGVVGYFTKPYDYQKLLQEVDRFISYKKAKKIF